MCLPWWMTGRCEPAHGWGLTGFVGRQSEWSMSRQHGGVRCSQLPHSNLGGKEEDCRLWGWPWWQMNEKQYRGELLYLEKHYTLTCWSVFQPWPPPAAPGCAGPPAPLSPPRGCSSESPGSWTGSQGQHPHWQPSPQHPHQWGSFSTLGLKGLFIVFCSRNSSSTTSAASLVSRCCQSGS